MRKNIRIYVDQKIEEGILLLNKKTSHYLKNVMRLSERDNINIFNEIDGEWLVEINFFRVSNQTPLYSPNDSRSTEVMGKIIDA